MIRLTDEQHPILEQLTHRRNTPQGLAKRAQILLKLNSGLSISQTALQLNTSRNTVRRWAKRWKCQAHHLASDPDESLEEASLSQRITATLSDEPRTGKPPAFSPEAVVSIVALACQEPQKFDRPISHWTADQLADEAQKQGIVERISPRSVGRFLKGVQS